MVFQGIVEGNFIRTSATFKDVTIYKCEEQDEIYRISLERTDYCYFTHICTGRNIHAFDMVLTTSYPLFVKFLLGYQIILEILASNSLVRILTKILTKGLISNEN